MENFPIPINRKLLADAAGDPVKSYRKLAAALLADFESWLRSRDFSPRENPVSARPGPCLGDDCRQDGHWGRDS